MDNARETASRLLDLLRHEQASMAEFLVALADFDRRRLWEPLGHASLFAFLHRELGLSKGASHFRKVAAELIQRFPEVVEPLRDGRLYITSVVELAKVITPENLAEVLPRFFHASKQEAKEVAAELRPRDPAPQRLVVTVPDPAPAPRATPSGAWSAPAVPEPTPAAIGGPVLLDELPRANVPPAEPDRTVRPKVEPLTADLRRLHVTVSRRFMEKLAAARDALSHSRPCADAEAILEAGLDLLLERAAKRRGLVNRPRPATLSPANAEEREASTASSPDVGHDRTSAHASATQETAGEVARHIPAPVRRDVWLRDGGCCQWRLANGGVCGSTNRLQFDHVIPVARGGRSTVANVRLLCQVHNLRAARNAFGDAWMDQFTRGARDAATGELVAVSDVGGG